MATSSIEVPTFDEVCDEMKQMVETLAEKIDPCGDWPQTVVFQTSEGFRTFPLDVIPLTTPGERAWFFETVLADVARSIDANRMAYISPAWYVLPEDDARYGEYIASGNAISAHPLRRECVNVVIVDSERTEAWVAEVTRRPHQPPILSAWDGPAEADGPLIDAMRSGLRTL